MSKLYFYEEDAETCTTLEFIKDMILSDGLKQKEVFKAKRMTGEGVFWCKYYFECGIVGDDCGTQCEKYKPRNGKSGRCVHSGYCYEAYEKILIKL